MSPERENLNSERELETHVILRNIGEKIRTLKEEERNVLPEKSLFSERELETQSSPNN